jgi:endonuclease/exonuclease/phosphatase family metal-dependent hydrolase
VHKFSGRTWSDADIAELLSLRHKCILAGDLNAKHPSWNSTVSNPSGEKLLLFDAGDFKISAPQCPTHYSTVGNGDILDSVVNKNIRLSKVIVSDILDSDHLPIIFHIPDHVTTKNVSAPFEKFTA